MDAKPAQCKENCYTTIPAKETGKLRERVTELFNAQFEALVWRS